MAAQYQFVMRSGPTIGKVYPLEAQEISIGRDSTNMVAINDVEVSRRHARMELRGSTYAIQDLGSTNGTFVNGQRVSGLQALNPGDSVSFGEGIVLTYEAAYDPNATMLSAKAPIPVAPVQRPAPVPAPAPAPAPVYAPPPAPAPVYSGQVPAGPVPMAPAPAKKSKAGLIIGVIVGVLILSCVCLVLFAYFAPQWVLCAPGIKILTNLVGPMLGYGVCP